MPFPTVSLSHQEASIILLSLFTRGQTEWKPQSQKTNQSDHMDHSLVWLNEDYEPCRVWPPKTDVMVESSDKTWSTGEGKGKPLEYSSRENPMNSMKRQKDRTLKDELPNILLEINGKITPEKMERRSQSKNNTQLWMWLVMEVKSDAMKSNIA